MRPAERHGGWVKKDRRPIINEISRKYEYTVCSTKAALNTFPYALSICEGDPQSTRDLFQSLTARPGQLDPGGLLPSESLTRSESSLRVVDGAVFTR